MRKKKKLFLVEILCINSCALQFTCSQLTLGICTVGGDAVRVLLSAQHACLERLAAT